MNKTRHFRFVGKKTADQIWEITQDGDSYTTRHGLDGGAMQTFSDTPGDKGKPGTKAYVDPIANCEFAVDREIRKKLEHGYIEYVDGKPLTEQVNKIDFDKPLPKNFSGFKPQTSIEDSALEKIHKAGKARYTRKYDGQCHLAVHHSYGWEIYTRRIDSATAKLPLHVKALESLKLPKGTIIIGELLCTDPSSGKDDFVAISRFCRSLPEEAIKLVTDKEIPEPKFLIFDFLFCNGKDLKNTCYDDRAKLWKNISGPRISSVEYFDLTPSNWTEYAKTHGWEGFVVTDGSSIPGSKFYSFDGDAKRPKGHHKLKPVFSEDCVAYAAVKGSGKRLNTVGAVFIKQRHPDTKEFFSCGKTGSGFTEADLEEVEKLCIKNKIPILEKDKEAEKLDLNRTEGLAVIELEYSERQLGTNKFRFPVFLRIRDDKAPEECFAQRLAPEEE